jgi:hypothetical protein
MVEASGKMFELEKEREEESKRLENRVAKKIVLSRVHRYLTR